MAEAAVIRPCRAADLDQVRAIYAIEVREGTASFELEPPDLAEMTRRFERVLGAGLPYLVAEVEGRLAGYAYAGPYRERPAYRHTVEDSVYVASWARRQGVARTLLEALIAVATAAGRRQMVAIIGDPDGGGSVALHRRCGFVTVGTLSGVGFKFGRWLDTVLMQRSLGDGATTPGEDGG